MMTPKFSVGDRVLVRSSERNPSIRPGVYKVMRAMPEGAEGRQYRVKNDLDSHERVLFEAELASA